MKDMGSFFLLEWTSGKRGRGGIMPDGRAPGDFQVVPELAAGATPGHYFVSALMSALSTL